MARCAYEIITTHARIEIEIQIEIGIEIGIEKMTA